MPAVVSHKSYGRSDRTSRPFYPALSVRGRPDLAHCLRPVPMLGLEIVTRGGRRVTDLWSDLYADDEGQEGRNHCVKQIAPAVTSDQF